MEGADGSWLLFRILLFLKSNTSWQTEKVFSDDVIDGGNLPINGNHIIIATIRLCFIRRTAFGGGRCFLAGNPFVAQRSEKRDKNYFLATQLFAIL